MVCIYLPFFLGSLTLLVVNAFYIKKFPQRTALAGGILTAFLTTSLIGIAQIVLRYYIYKRNHEPFTAFWGQEYGGDAGRIILQSDQLQGMTKDLTQDLCRNLAEHIKGSRDLPDFATDLNSLLASKDEDGKYKYGEKRLFKARTWLNRCDAEGARNIREAFTDEGFEPPRFATSERAASGKLDPKVPFEIYMGLGYTDRILDEVNESCRGFLSIERTDFYGDAICLRDSLAGQAREKIGGETNGPHIYDKNSGKHKKTWIISPDDWDLENYIKSHEPGGTPVSDYAYILRDIRLRPHQKPLIVFHVGGFTEDGTWAAGHYLKLHWTELYERYVKKEKREDRDCGGRFVVLLKGQSPFTESQPDDPKHKQNAWSEVTVITHKQVDQNWGCEWTTDLHTLKTQHNEKHSPNRAQADH
jgi:hypothetical protein